MIEIEPGDDWDSYTRVLNDILKYEFKQRSAYRLSVLKHLDQKGVHGLTPFGTTRLTDLRKELMSKIRVTSLAWDNVTAHGSASIESTTNVYLIRVNVKEGKGVASCTCHENPEPEGYCWHILGIASVFSELGLDTTIFSPYTVQNWIEMYLHTHTANRINWFDV